jgi:hypothetical protein
LARAGYETNGPGISINDPANDWTGTGNSITGPGSQVASGTLELYPGAIFSIAGAGYVVRMPLRMLSHPGFKITYYPQISTTFRSGKYKPSHGYFHGQSALTGRNRSQGNISIIAIVSMFSIGAYSALETVFITFDIVKNHRSLYFWSMQVAS